MHWGVLYFFFLLILAKYLIFDVYFCQVQGTNLSSFFVIVSCVQSTGVGHEVSRFYGMKKKMKKETHPAVHVCQVDGELNGIYFPADREPLRWHNAVCILEACRALILDYCVEVRVHVCRF